VDQSTGVAGHRGAATPAGRPGAAEGGGADRCRGGHQLLSPPHPTSPGSSPPGLRILGAVRPHSGRVAQGLQGGDDGSREEHLRQVDLQPGVPQGTWDIQPFRTGMSSTLLCSQIRSLKFFFCWYLGLIELSHLVFAAPRWHLLVPGTTVRQRSV
jgi:hypothetical protein